MPFEQMKKNGIFPITPNGMAGFTCLKRKKNVNNQCETWKRSIIHLNMASIALHCISLYEHCFFYNRSNGVIH